MEIRLLGLFPVVDLKGLRELNIAETVTVFNDLCLFAPASLIDRKIQWEERDPLTAKATFYNGQNKISAILFFNEAGQLVNFSSDDRYTIKPLKQYPFSTPASHYLPFKDRMVPTYGETIWHYPDGEFVYGKFHLKKILYNVSTNGWFQVNQN
jgi:hypothetical protein